MTIDTLAYVKELEAGGVSRDVAEAHVRALTDHALPDVATKGDLALLKADLNALGAQLTIRFGSVIVVATGIMLAAKFFA